MKYFFQNQGWETLLSFITS